jgi:hypothetical protein
MKYLNNIAFVFLCRKNVFHSNIWCEYFKENKPNIFVYSDKNETPDNYVFSKYHQVHSIDKDREHTVDVKFDFLKNKSDDFNHVIFLTEDCLPIRPIEELCNFLSNTQTSIFTFEKDPHTLNGPFYYRHFEYKGERYKNNDWVCLHKKHINLLKNSEKDVSCFKNNCSGEHFVSSILNSYNVLNEIFKAELLLECWDGYSNNFPSVFNANDKEKIYSLKNNNPHAFFLRKFKTSISDDYIKNILL